MNLVRVTFLLMALAAIYFVAFLLEGGEEQKETEYLFFGLAFQIIAG